MIISRTKGQLGGKLSSSVTTATQDTQVFLPCANFWILFAVARLQPICYSLQLVNKVDMNVYLTGLVRTSNGIKCGKINL